MLELKPNKELLLMGIASAPILQNPLLAVRHGQKN
jgi:hypothetical protein